MTALIIGRLVADVPAAGTGDPPANRVDRLARLVSDRALAAHAAEFDGLSGRWCVRRLELELPLRPDEADTTAADRWALLIGTAVVGLRPDDVNVLHYRSRGQQLLELVCGVVLGDVVHDWAWRQAGLLVAGDPDPVLDPARAVLAALCREPELAVPVLSRAAQLLGVRPLDRLLGEQGWLALAAIAGMEPSRAVAVEEPRPPQAGPAAAGDHGEAQKPWTGKDFATEPDSVGRHPGQDPAARNSAVGAASAGYDRERESRTGPLTTSVYPIDDPGRHTHPGQARAIAVVAASHLATAFLAAGGARSPGVLACWAALCVAEVEPQRPALVSEVAAELGRRMGVIAHTDAAPSQPPGLGPGRPLEGPSRRPDSAALPASPSSGRIGATPTGAAGPGGHGYRIQEGQGTTTGHLDRTTIEGAAGTATVWGGLPFLLNTAAAAGLPGRIDDDPRLAARARRWSLHHLALGLVPVAEQDPAALAMAGLTPDSAPPAGPLPDEAEHQALHEHTAHWATVTEHLLRSCQPARDTGPVPTVWGLARRRGRVVADPGWLEIQLELDEVDMAVRRAGLDLDPGWLAWLGTVVVFRYV